MISRVILTLPRGRCLAREYDGDVFILSPISQPLELDDMPHIAQALYVQGWRNVTLIALVDNEFKRVRFEVAGIRIADGWAKDAYPGYSPAWETIALTDVEALIGEKLNDCN